MNQKENSNYRQSKQFKEYRSYLLKKYNNTCQICGKQYKGKQTKLLHIHHKNESTYGNEQPDKDLTVLCSQCHKYFTRLSKVYKAKNPTFTPTLYSPLLANILNDFFTTNLIKEKKV